MSEWQPLEAGTVVHDRYEVEALLGKGGFGATYRARDRERFDQPCALKELLPAKATNPKVLELFEREARILLALRHPGIPSLHAYFTESSRYYLVQDFVAGATLAQVVEQRGPLPEHEVRAALAMQEARRAKNAARAERGLVTCQIGIGVHSGDVLHGFIGAAGCMAFTVIGDAVNRAARYCDGAAGGEVPISPDVHQRVWRLVEAEPVSVGTKHEGSL